MKRLAIAVVGLAVAVALAFGAGAFALHVWPGQEQGHDPRLMPLEALDIVLSVPARQDPTKRLVNVVDCPSPLPKKWQEWKGDNYAIESVLWSVEYQGRGIWAVIANCDAWESGNLVGFTYWMVDDVTWKVIPADHLARSLGP
jgi:hypothetical protein